LTHHFVSYQFSVLLEQLKHTILTRTIFIQDISYVHYRTLLHWLVPNLIDSRTKPHTDFTKKTQKIFAWTILHNIMARNNSQYIWHNKYVITLKLEELHKIFLTYITWHINLVRNNFQWFSHKKLILNLRGQRLNKIYLTYFTSQFIIGS